MWISIWSVAIAIAIGFSVMAIAMQTKNNEMQRWGDS